MQREVNRLQNSLLEKQSTINRLNITIKQLQDQVSNSRNQINLLKQKINNSFSYQNVPDRQIITTLQAKLAASAWQIVQLKKMNIKYEQAILKLQTQLINNQQQLNLKMHELQQKNLSKQINYIDQQSLKQTFRQWEEAVREKTQLMTENLVLKQKLKTKQTEINQKLSFYLNQVMNLSVKLKESSQGQKNKLTSMQNLFKQLKKQNQQLRQALSKKNQQLLLLYQQTKMVSTTKASDMHTIKCLKSQLKKKGEALILVLSKLKQTEDLKKKLLQYSSQCSDSIGQSNKILQNLQKLKIQNGLLKQKLKNQQQKVNQKQQIIKDSNKKIYELLVENEACHQILHQSRGYSEIYSRDIQQKVQKFLNKMQYRKQNCESWLDVTQLIKVNQKLKMAYNQIEYI